MIRKTEGFPGRRLPQGKTPTIMVYCIREAEPGNALHRSFGIARGYPRKLTER